MIANHLVKKQDGIYFTGDKLELLIPQYFLDSGLAMQFSERVDLFGLVDVILNTRVKTTLNIPSMFTIFPSFTEEITIDEEKYLVATFLRKSKFCNLSMAKSSGNIEIFLNMIFSGKLPKNLKYSDIIKVWLKNLTLNSINIGTSSAILEIIIAEVCRYKDNPEIRFGEYLSKNPNTPETDYICLSIRDICAQNSTFAAMTFEDMDRMIVSSLNMNKYDKFEIESPLEKVIKM